MELVLLGHKDAISLSKVSRDFFLAGGISVFQPVLTSGLGNAKPSFERLAIDLFFFLLLFGILQLTLFVTSVSPNFFFLMVLSIVSVFQGFIRFANMKEYYVTITGQMLRYYQSLDVRILS